MGSINEEKDMSSMEDIGTLSGEDVMDVDGGNGADDIHDYSNLHELGEGYLRSFCKKAAVSFFKEHGLIGHQIKSYNNFIKYGLQRVFDYFGEIVIEPGYDGSKKREDDWRHASVTFGKVSVDRPAIWNRSGDGEQKLLPRTARLQNMTYSSRMKVDVTFQVYTKKLVQKSETGKDQSYEHDIKFEDKREIMIGRIPVMVKSELCWMNEAMKDDCDFDNGGYFLIKGSEKSFIAQEQICMKRLWISSSQGWTVAYKSEVKRNRLIIRLEADPNLQHIKGAEKILTVYFMSTEIPVWILFYALGISSDQEVVNLIDFENDEAGISNILYASIRDADKKCAGFRRGKNALSYFDKLLKATRFPPGEDEDCISLYLFSALRGLNQKARFLGYMVKCLLQAYCGYRKCDNRDDLRNKRLELASELLERELKVHIAHARRKMTKALQRDLDADRNPQAIEHYLDASIITNGLARAFSTGAWSHPFKRMERVSGVVANLGRANPMQTLIDLRKSRQQVAYTGRVGDARYPHPSHWGNLCFLSTPDGENCGLVKNLATTGLVSTDVQEPFVDILFDCGMEKVLEDATTSLSGKFKVFLNGDWVGVCEDSLPFTAALRFRRRKEDFPRQVEIKRDDKHREVRIFSDAGRTLRPLLVVENLHKIKELKGKCYTFESLLEKGIIELVGCEEEEDYCIAWDIKYLLEEVDGKPNVRFTHCELDMSFLLGLSCGIIPFANHDNAKRVLYQSQKHCQQAIGFSTTNPNIRADTLLHQLYYPQRPLFRTMAADCLGQSDDSLGQTRIPSRPELFNGQNPIVAVNVHFGYNQEDSLVMNRASLERGMFRSEHVRSYKAEVDNHEDIQERRRKLEDHVSFGKKSSRIGRIDCLDDDGFPFIGANLQSGDVIIGRSAESGADHSIKLKHTERGTVQKVVLSSNDDGKNFAVVSLKQVRSPGLGDKFSSMHGQKGVLGFLEAQENFSFTAQGIVPDVVINPHAFPTRQTPGQLLEAALSKGIACGGLLKHATPFSTLSIDDITEQLHRAGFSRWGKERVYDGRTGEMVQSLIFIGPTFYQRLVHMAEDKVKFRNTGPVHPLTRQPVADRKRFGGIKFGEMERDSLIAHGASSNLHERLFTLSDSSQMHVCQNCKNVASIIQRNVQGGHKIRGPYCRICTSADHVVKIHVPYGAKLLYQELFCMGINLRFESRIC